MNGDILNLHSRIQPYHAPVPHHTHRQAGASTLGEAGKIGGAGVRMSFRHSVYPGRINPGVRLRRCPIRYQSRRCLSYLL